MGGNVFKDIDGNPLTTTIKREDIEPTLRYLSPIIGIQVESDVNKYNKITKRGLMDCTLGSAGRTRSGILGKKDVVGDIDVILDDGIYEKDEIVSRLVRKLGPENIGKPVAGGSVIPTKVPIAGLEENGFVQVDFIIGNSNLLEFTYHCPDPETNSQFNGTVRNELIRAVTQDMRRQVRDVDTREIVALIGPTYLFDQGLVQQWRHFPMRKDGKGRTKTIKPISRTDFNSSYPEHVGKEKEIVINTPAEIIEYLFPKSNLTIDDFDSFETIRDAIIDYKPSRADSIFNLFAQAMHRRGFEVPEGLVMECVNKAAKNLILKETRNISLNIVTESIAKPNKFEDFRNGCLNKLKDLKQLDHHTVPLANADIIPTKGMLYLMKECGLLDDWVRLNRVDYGTDYHHKTNDYADFYKDVCQLIGSDSFFYVTEHYDLKVTPDSFLNSLIEMEFETD